MTEKIIKRDEYLFLVAYAFWLTSAVLGLTLWQEYNIVNSLCSNFRKIGYLLLIVKFFLKRYYSKKDVIAILVIIYVCGISSFAKYNIQLVSATIFACSAGNIRRDRIFKWTLSIQTIIMFFTILGSQTGLIEDVIWYEGTERIRHSLGYDYCGYPAHFLLFMTLMWICIQKKTRIFDSLVLILLNYIMYIFTDAKTDFYLVVFGVVGQWVWERMGVVKTFVKIRGFLSKWGFHLICVFSIVIHWIYNSKSTFMVRVNAALNGRLQLGYDAIQTYGFSLFGNQIRWFGQGSLKADPTRIYNYVDCSFLKEGLTFGVIFLILLAVGFYLTGKQLEREKDYTVSWAILISLAYSVFNAHLCVLTFNGFILILGSVFSDDRAFEGMEMEERVNCSECIQM